MDSSRDPIAQWCKSLVAQITDSPRLSPRALVAACLLGVVIATLTLALLAIGALAQLRPGHAGAAGRLALAMPPS